MTKTTEHHGSNHIDDETSLAGTHRIRITDYERVTSFDVEQLAAGHLTAWMWDQDKCVGHMSISIDAAIAFAHRLENMARAESVAMSNRRRIDWVTTMTHMTGCSACINCANQAIAIAMCEGSTGGSMSDGNHCARVERRS